MGLYDKNPLLKHRPTLEAIEAGAGLDQPPLHVRLEPSEICNFRCDFCWWHSERLQPILPDFDFTGHRRLELKRFLDLIDELAAMGVKAISFTGAGDPLVYPGMEKVLARLITNGLAFAVTSNLAMPLSDELLSLLMRASWIRWSMNAGTPEVYRKVHNPRGRNSEASFGRVQENVRRLNQLRSNTDSPPPLNASFIVSRINSVDVRPAARLARSLGVDVLAFRPDTPWEKKDVPNKYQEPVRLEILKAMREFSSNGYQVLMSEERHEDIRKLGDPELVCYYSNHSTYIAANGDVYPCCYTRYDARYVIGNVTEQRFEEFWTSEARRENFRRLFFDQCPSCPHGRTNQILRDLSRGHISTAEFDTAGHEGDYFV